MIGSQFADGLMIFVQYWIMHSVMESVHYNQSISFIAFLYRNAQIRTVDC